jgi:hypothetical protein
LRLVLGILCALILGLTVTGADALAGSSSEMPDIRVADITVSAEMVNVGDPFLLTATVRNYGEQPACNVSISIATGVRTLEVVSLTPGEAVPQLDAGEAIAFEACLRAREAGEFEVGVVVMADGYVVTPPSEWIQVNASAPAPSSRISPWSVARVAVPAAAFALGVGWYLSGSSRRRNVRVAAGGLATVVRGTLPQSRKGIIAALLVFGLICMVLFVPHLFPSDPSPRVAVWIMRLYYPILWVAPVALVLCYGIVVRRASLAFFMGFVPLALLALSELASENWRIGVDSHEALWLAIALGVIGVGAGSAARRNWVGTSFGVLGLIMWIAICRTGISNYVGFWT